MGQILSFLGNIGGGKGTIILAGLAFLLFGFGVIQAPEGVNVLTEKPEDLGMMALSLALIRLRTAMTRTPTP